MWSLLKLAVAGGAFLLMGLLVFSEQKGNAFFFMGGLGGILFLVSLFVLFDVKENKPKKRNV